MDYQRIAFRSRNRCPACGDSGSETVWSGRFSDQDVKRYIEQFHYSVATSQLLGDQNFELVRCSSCNLMYHRLVIADSAIPQVYRDWTDQAQVQRFEAAHGRGDQYQIGISRIKMILRIKVLLERRFGRSLRLLDFGCGGGQDIAQAAMLGFDAYGIDVSLTRMEHANRLGCEVYADLDAFDQNVTGKLHAITMIQVLEHLTEPSKVLSQLRDKLEPGGVLYVAVPNCSTTTKPRSFTEFHNVHPIEHVNAFTPKTLQSTVERVGFLKASRPSVFAATGLAGVVRTMAGMIFLPNSTDQFFTRD